MLAGVCWAMAWVGWGEFVAAGIAVRGHSGVSARRLADGEAACHALQIGLPLPVLHWLCQLCGAGSSLLATARVGGAVAITNAA